MTRTADSVRLMLEAEGAPSSSPSPPPTPLSPPTPLVDPVAFRPLLARGLRLAIGAFGALERGAAAPSTPVPELPRPELKVTVLVCWGSAAAEAARAVAPLLTGPLFAGPPAASEERLPAVAEESAVLPLADADAAEALSSSSRSSSPTLPFTLITHVTPLPPRRAPPIKVVVRGAPRANARAKDTEWVRQRVGLERDKPADVEEVLLADGDGDEGAVLEGTQTNVFAVVRRRRTAGSGGGEEEEGPLTVCTAEEGVLAGTVRRLVLEVCAAEGVAVELRPPTVGGIAGDDGEEAWVGAFLTSTSRLVLPIDEVAWGGGGPGGGAEERRRVFGPPAHPLVARLEGLVASQVEAHSVDVFGAV